MARRVERLPYGSDTVEFVHYECENCGGIGDYKKN